MMQDLAVVRSFVGDTEGAISAYDMQGSPSTARKEEIAKVNRALDDLRAEEAISAIVQRAKMSQIVLLNEAHHVPLHRAFAQKLAKELRKLGFRYLACEGFGPSVGDKRDGNAQGWVTTSTGYYTNEPVFAGFVNAALNDGWTLVHYDDWKDGTSDGGWDEVDQRERSQARNIVDRVLKKDRDAKIFVLVGYHHLLKSLPGDSETPTLMGEYLKKWSGVPTLHIDQITYFGHPLPNYERETYGVILDRMQIDQPSVLVSKAGEARVFGGLEGRVDLQVIFPKYGTSGNRPNWLITLANRSPMPVPAYLLPRQGRRVIKAINTRAPSNAVPGDIVVVEANSEAPQLMLPPGEYKFVHEE